MMEATKLGEHGMTFYKLLHKVDDFQWDDVIPRSEK
jgi:hypothetical protein